MVGSQTYKVSPRSMTAAPENPTKILNGKGTALGMYAMEHWSQAVTRAIPIDSLSSLFFSLFQCTPGEGRGSRAGREEKQEEDSLSPPPRHSSLSPSKAQVGGGTMLSG